ncbi:patatin-like phospholipase family protein [Maritalea mediterranea]|uniref:Patatin-like phospholipase family protein n=1 Tax=Maritalea mediterranea TaxID=2909667 RepID=A0ABS9E812_9HYPH|nr:patatin-like phospholipase family protein [Maritalea mediterranea]MCF4098319.1 patatin-like phospholipase family protein [Maritalea mediterranea]
MLKRPICRQASVLFVLFAITLVGGCASQPMRADYTMDMSTNAAVLDIEDARVWADDPRIANGGLWSPNILSDSRGPVSMLTLSGGGAEGAFGAGLLSGWSQTGNRPSFSVVSGTSAGALLAPFAFLGPRYDPVLEQFFTRVRTSKLVRVAGLSAIFGESVFSAQPLKNMIAHYVTPQLLEDIAREHAKGRRLYVITTNIDTQRTAIWNMGAIASSTSPHALELFRQILLASASIPGVLPPQQISVAHKDHIFQEMHVDGGVTANIMLLPESILKAGDNRNLPKKPTIYLLFNGKIGHEYKLVKPHTVSILERAFGTAIKASSRQSILAAQQFANRHGWQLKLAALRTDFELPIPEVKLDEQQLSNLFQEGLRVGQQPDAWRDGL